jgi:cytosine permease
MSNLPNYLAAAKPVPLANRAPWYKTIAPAYIGVMLWFVFWQDLVTGGAGKDVHSGGVIAHDFFYPFLGLAIAAVICHFLFYLVPGLLGMRTGLPLYVVGTSTYGALGGLFMPGLLMGLLQFGWLAVNSFMVAKILCKCLGVGMAADGLEATVPSWPHGIIAATFAILAAFIGLKGIKYMARVATYLPLIPVIVLLGLLALTCTGLGNFNLGSLALPESARPELAKSWTNLEIVEILCVYIVGFFATAGAAGVDIASNSRTVEDVHIGGITGVLLPTVLSGWITMLIVAGAYGGNMVLEAHRGNYNPVDLMSDIFGAKFPGRGATIANIAMIGLAISSLPGACFSSLIAANSFKTTMPRVNPFISVGIGALVAVFLAVTGVVGKVIWVFVVIGASFGPVCGAMMADYFLSGRKWSGPRAGFNPAGWISWLVGFAVGAFNLVVDLLSPTQWAMHAMPHLKDWQGYVPVPPVAAFVVGFALYIALSVVGLRTRKLPMPGVTE